MGRRLPLPRPVRLPPALLRRLAAAAALPAAANAAAHGATAATSPVVPALGASVLQMLFGLAVVIAVLLACLWLLRRLSVPRGSVTPAVLGATAVGPRERVVLVEVGERVLVLGVAPGRVSRLHDLPRAELPAAAPAAAGEGFAGWLQQAVERRNAR